MLSRANGRNPGSTYWQAGAPVRRRGTVLSQGPRFNHGQICSAWSVGLITVLVASALFSTTVSAHAKSGSKVSPASDTMLLAPGASAPIDVTVRLGEAVPKADVLFVFDVTGSMGEELDQAKEHGRRVMSDVKDKVPDTVFGVASFCDYPGSYDYSGYSAVYGSDGDYPWRLDQRLTGSVSNVDATIGDLSIRDGQDSPENYARVLQECAKVNWRAGSKRVVVLFGDAPPHDEDFGGRNTGGDPGPDKKAGTADDVDFEAAVVDLARAGVQVISVDSGEDADAQESFEYASEKTSGAYTQLGEASELPNTVTRLLEDAVSNVSKIELRAKPNMYKSWLTKVSVIEGDATEVEAPAIVKFRATITMPKDARLRDSTFQLNAYADGALLGGTVIDIVAGKREGGSAFSVKDHGFRFKNRDSDGSDWKHLQEYFGLNICTDATGEHLWAADEFMRNVWTKEQGGTCFGMSLGEMALYLNPATDSLLSAEGKTSVAQLSPAWGDGSKFHRTSGTIMLGDFLNDYHRRQKDWRVLRARSDPPSMKDAQAQLVEHLDAGRPIGIDIWTESSGHTITALSYRREGTKLYVNVHDSNHPTDEKRYLVINTSSGKWAYDLGWVAWTGAKGTLTLVPVTHVSLPGVAPWNPGREVHEDAGVVYVSGGDAEVSRGPGVVEVPESSATPTSTMRPEDVVRSFVVSPEADFQATLGAKSSASAFARGSSWTMDSVTGVPVSIKTKLTGAASLSSVDGAGSCDVAVSREASGSSKVYKLVGLDTGAAGAAKVIPSADFDALAVEGSSATSGTYDVSVVSISHGKQMYGVSDVAIGGKDIHTVRVADWSTLDSATPVLSIDRGGDGSVDETMPLVRISSRASGGGGGASDGGDGLLILLALAVLGAIAWLVVSSSKSKARTSDAQIARATSSTGERPMVRFVRGDVDWPIVSGVTTIGRGPDNDLVIGHPGVSRHHARVVVKDGSVVLEDLGSSGGTFVNGSATMSALLADGDIVAFGDSVFVVHIST